MTRVLLVLFVLGAAIWSGPEAMASCHAFTVGANSSVDEGNKVSVVVERDGAVSDSSVLVMTMDGTAKEPGDYTAFSQRVSFTGDETQKTVTVQTKEDAVAESNEAFTIMLSDAEGCSNVGFTYGSPASVTIKDDDAKTSAPHPTAPPATTIIPANTRTPTPSPSPTPSASPSASPTPSLSPTPTFTPLEVTEDGGFPWLPVLAVVGFLAAGGGALILTRMRGARPSA